MDEKQREQARVRQENRRKRLKAAKLHEVRGILAPLTLHPKIKEAAQAIIETKPE